MWTFIVKIGHLQIPKVLWNRPLVSTGRGWIFNLQSEAAVGRYKSSERGIIKFLSYFRNLDMQAAKIIEILLWAVFASISMAQVD